MNKQENKLVPELRFPEFRNEKEWDLKNFSEFIKLDRGSSPRPIQDYLTQDKNGVNWIKIGDTKNAINSVIYTVEEKITAEGAEKSRKVKKGELILANSMSYGKTYELALDGCIYDGWFVLRKFEKSFDKNFLKQLLNSDFMQEQYKRLSAGGIVQNISSDIVYNSKLFHIKIEEQQKIASCLSSLDDVIAAHTDKLENLKQYKKGLLQNLFPQEGETVPKLRFKEFENDGEWEENSLGSVFTSYSGGTPNTSERKYYGGNIPFIRSAEINRSKTELFITELGLNNSSAKLVAKGDLLIALYGANSGDVGISQIDGAINQAILCLKSDYSNVFVYHFLSLKKEWIISKYIQGGQGNLSGDIFKSIELFLPKKEEQQKIATFLSSIDDLIQAETDKIAQLKAHKKGLLQVLFPKIET